MREKGHRGGLLVVRFRPLTWDKLLKQYSLGTKP